MSWYIARAFLPFASTPNNLTWSRQHALSVPQQLWLAHRMRRLLIRCAESLPAVKLNFSPFLDYCCPHECRLRSGVKNFASFVSCVNRCPGCYIEAVTIKVNRCPGCYIEAITIKVNRCPGCYIEAITIKFVRSEVVGVFLSLVSKRLHDFKFFCRDRLNSSNLKRDPASKLRFRWRMQEAEVLLVRFLALYYFFDLITSAFDQK